MIVLDREQTAEARALMERVLRGGEPIEAEYPLVFREEFSGRVLALAEEEQVKSSCAVLVRDFVIDGDTLVRGGLIGSVATDPDHRDQGLATRLLVEAEATLQEQGCAFALLWAENPEFYARRGYGPIGTEVDFLIPDSVVEALPQPSAGALVREMVPDDAANLHALYERHASRVARSAAESAALLACPGMTVLVLERDDEAVAYACLGRGKDLADAIHEWGGAVADVLTLVRAHLAARSSQPDAGGGLFLMAPPSAVALTERLSALGGVSRRGILGLGKILDRSAAVALLEARLGDAGSAELIDADDGRSFVIRGPVHEGRLDDEGALALLFSASQVRPDVEQFLSDLGISDAQLPVEPFVWGLDSI